jgi:hypothetical protein
MHHTSLQTSATDTHPAKRGAGVRILVWGALLVVMGLGFVGYLMPGVRLNWETIAAMCGF